MYKIKKYYMLSTSRNQQKTQKIKQTNPKYWFKQMKIKYINNSLKQKNND